MKHVVGSIKLRAKTPTYAPTALPINMNYYTYNGKYYSTLANVYVNSANSFCQYAYFYLPTNWVLAPDTSDSLYAIYYNNWSTTTVVVASGVGYYSKSYYGSINRANMLLSGVYSYGQGYSYYCSPCNCEILIMYSPSSPSYSPVVYHDDTYSSTSSSSSYSSSSSAGSPLYSIIVVPVFIFLSCVIFYFRYRQRVRATQQIQQIQVQPPIPQEGLTAGYYGQPPIAGGDNHYGMVAQVYPIMVYGNNYNMQQQPQPQQHPYSQQSPQPGYIQLPPQQGSWPPQIHGGCGGQSHPQQQQVYGYGQQQNGYVYPEPQVYAYGVPPQVGPKIFFCGDCIMFNVNNIFNNCFLSRMVGTIPLDSRSRSSSLTETTTIHSLNHIARPPFLCILRLLSPCMMAMVAPPPSNDGDGGHPSPSYIESSFYSKK